jgi:VWFA-related protein
MNMRPFALLVLAAGVAVSAAPQAPQPQPIFRSGVDLVRFDVRVTDASGRPLTDLRADELEILENGRVLPLLLFQHLAEPSGMYAEAALRSVSAEVSSNRGSPRGHLYILIFDQAHIAPGNEQVARRAAETFIKTRVRPFDRVAVIGIPGPGPELGFTADRTRAIAELAKVHADLERQVKSAGGDISVHEAYEIAGGNDKVISDVMVRQSIDLTADVGAAAAAGTSGVADRGGRAKQQTEDPTTTRKLIVENARTVVAQADASARDSLQRLSDVIAQYRTVEGRKTVVLFSEGFHQRNVSRELEHVAAAAAQSYAVFYSFDLNRRAGTDVAQPLTTSTEALARTEPLGSLAAETDGALITDAASHLDSALARIADQAQDYYIVGFTPSAAALEARGDYRRVSVRVRRPGARVSARTGYATPKAGQALDRRRAIDAALAAPFGQQALRVDYTTYTLRSDNAGRARVLLSLEADLPVQNAEHDSADVVFLVRDARDGRVVASGTDTMALPTTAVGGNATGIGTYRVHFDVPPGSYMMRTVVREPGGLVGSADRKLDVRGLSGPDVTVGDVILGSVTGALPVRARAYAQDGLTGMLEAYGRSREQLQALTVTATVVPVGPVGPLDMAQPVATVRADLGDTMSTGTGMIRRATFAVPLTSVPPGAYQARVKVTAGSETVADLTRELDVVAGSRPPPPPSAFAPQSPGSFAGTSPPMRPEDVLNGDFVRSARAALRASTAAAAVRATKGFDLFAQADYGSAAVELSEALRLDQTNAATAFVLGWAYDEAGDHRQAIGAWRAAAIINPKMVPAHLALADGYLRMSERALAEQAIRAGLMAMPGSPELQAKLAQIQGKS